MKGVIDMKKLYYAYVKVELDDYFQSKLQECPVEVIHRMLRKSENNEYLFYYVLKAEEGIIDPRWELES